MTTSEPPLILVSHLPSAASFYGVLTQPLGLRFLSATSTVPACLHFGYLLSTPTGPRKVTVFTVSQSAHPQLSHITLSAPSSKAVLDFHSKSQLYAKATGRQNTFEQAEKEERALTRDFDGNVIEAVCDHGALTLSAGGAPGFNQESKRVLEWQQVVARSISDSEVGGSEAGARGGAPVFRRSETFPCDRSSVRIVVRETVTEHSSNGSEPENPPPEQKAGGISSKAVIGTLLGAAAGAVFAYAVTRSESPPPSVGSTGRRASAPQYTHEPIHMDDRERVVETGTIPARSYVSEREREKDIRPRYVQYAIAAPPAPSRAPALSKIDEGSYISTNSHRSHRSKKNRETTYTRPLAILPPPTREQSPDNDAKSHVSHRSHRSRRRSEAGRSPGTESELGRRRAEREAEDQRERNRDRERERNRDRESDYMSARSNHSVSTVKPFKPTRSEANVPPAAPQPPPAASPSRVSTSSRRHKGHSDRRSNVSARHVPVVSAENSRQVPRMVSGLGRDAFASDGDGDGDGMGGYATSVAPSDSVSSVGSKRERERLAGRMLFRERAKGVLWGHT